MDDNQIRVFFLPVNRVGTVNVLQRENVDFNFSRGGTCHGSSLVSCFLLSGTLFVFISLYVSRVRSILKISN